MKYLYKFFLNLVFIFFGFSLFTFSAHASTAPRVYVTNDGSSTVSVIDSGTNNVITTIPLGATAHYLALSPDGKRLYADVSDADGTNGSLLIFDTATYTEVATIPIGNIGNYPGHMVSSPDGTRLYVSVFSASAVLEIDTTTNTVITTIPVPSSPESLALSNDGTRLYVASPQGNIVSVVDTTNNTVLNTLSVQAPSVMMLSPNGSRLYVSNGNSNTVTVIDTVNITILTAIQVQNGTGEEHLTVNSTNTRLYVSNFNANTVSVVDTVNNVLLTAVPVGSAPNGLGILPDDTRVYVANDGSIVNPNSNTVSVIDTASNTVVDNIVVGSNPHYVVVEKKPSVHTITVATSPVQVNSAITASATFAEPGVAGTHTASWNWGDGTTPTSGTVTESNSLGSVSDAHTYTAAGVYPITLTVTDVYGNTGSSQYQYVAVYDPSAGFLTGSGKYTSQAGWDTQNTTATGDVKLGIQAKYTTGNTPTGNSKITFKAGNLDFASTSYSWLVVSGAKATLQGTGTINGSGTYTILFSGIDGSQTGGSNLIRVKITDSSNNVIYDTQSGAADTADPTTALSNGSIKVH